MEPEEPDPRGSLARLQKRLLGRIRRMMGPEARDGVESGDVLQSVNAATLARLQQGKLEGDQLLPWMTEVARNKIVDAVRRRKEDELPILSGDVAGSAHASPASQLGEMELGRVLLEALAGLAPERRRVVTLRVEEELPWTEIARTLGRSEEAVRKLYHRTLLELGQLLASRRVGPDEAWRG